MAPAERAVMESVEGIMPDAERANLDDLPRERETVGGTHQPWVDSVERVRFWRRQDPLYLTEFNERRMEHYGRVAYANLRFSRPAKGIEGWRTDMGRVIHQTGTISGQTRAAPDDSFRHSGRQDQYLRPISTRKEDTLEADDAARDVVL